MLATASDFRDTLEADGLSVPRIVAGGGSFPAYASISDPALELSPGQTPFSITTMADVSRPSVHTSGQNFDTSD